MPSRNSSFKILENTGILVAATWRIEAGIAVAKAPTKDITSGMSRCIVTRTEAESFKMVQVFLMTRTKYENNVMSLSIKE